MLMVCPNCKSNDIITVEGKSFCVNCGRVLSDVENEKFLAQKPKAVKTKKKGPGRPRAAKLDAPRAAVNVVAFDSITRPTPKSSPPVKQSATKESIDSQKDEVVVLKKSVEPRPARGLIKSSLVVRKGLKALTLKWIALVIPGSLLVALSIAYTIYLLNHNTGLTLLERLVVPIGAFITGFIWLRYIRTAVMFQRAGVNDHRLYDVSTALKTTILATPRLLAFNLRHTAAALVELSALGAVVYYGGSVTLLPNYLHIAILFIIIFALLYLLVSLWIVQRLIEAAIVISNLRLDTAHWLGWKLWRKHRELLNIRFMALIVNIILTGLIGYGIYIATKQMPIIYTYTSGIVAGTIWVGLLVVISGGATESCYRQIVNITMKKKAPMLLGQRRRAKKNKLASFLFYLGLVLPLAASAAFYVIYH